jgi:ribosomal protein S18 acetylase RimI-like enzyme
MEEMLYEAATWRGESHPPHADLLQEPRIAVYLAGWGREGDTGFVAESDEGERVGAAWFRLFASEEHGFGFVGPDVPELTVGVRPDLRGQGVATALLETLISHAQRARIRALSLSVEDDNPAFRLYARLGFVPVARVGNALTMQLDLA